MISTLTPRPDHVPEALVRNLDMARCDCADGDVQHNWKERAQDGGPHIF